MRTPPAFVAIGATLKWIGIAGLAMGVVGSVYAVVTAIQTRTGWGLSPLERCCLRGDLNKAALALLLGSMFFVLAGAGLILIARPLIRLRSPRWPTWLARSLFVYSACSIALGVVLVVQLRERVASTVALVGMVSYCLLVALGLLIASWGFKRFAGTV